MAEGDAQRDRHAAFEHLFISLHPRLLRYAHRSLDAESAADVASQAMFVLWTKKADIGRDADDPQLNALAFRIVDGLVRNTARSTTRRRNLLARLMRTHRDQDSGDIADAVARSADAKRLLATLSAQDRELISLVMIKFRTSEIAAALGISAGAAEMRLRRLRDRIVAAESAASISEGGSAR